MTKAAQDQNSKVKTACFTENMLSEQTLSSGIPNLYLCFGLKRYNNIYFLNQLSTGISPTQTHYYLLLRSIHIKYFFFAFVFCLCFSHCFEVGGQISGISTHQDTPIVLMKLVWFLNILRTFKKVSLLNIYTWDWFEKLFLSASTDNSMQKKWFMLPIIIYKAVPAESI